MRTSMRSLLLGLCAASVVLPAAAEAAVVVYPGAQRIPASGTLPARAAGTTETLTYNMAMGEVDGHQVVVTGAGNEALGIGIDRGTLPAGVTVDFFKVHFVSFPTRAGTLTLADALLPMGQSATTAEQPNQPLYVQITVPAGTTPGLYGATLTVTQNGTVAGTVPLTLTIFNVTVPHPASKAGNLLTSYHISAPTYVNAAKEMYGFPSDNARLRLAQQSLFAFLAKYRVSPQSWGFGDPSAKDSGYKSSGQWWKDRATNMRDFAGNGFSAMRIPLASNRSSANNYHGGRSPYKPHLWCAYLKNIRAFWMQNGWLDGTKIPYVYALDEPGATGMLLVQKQAKFAHKCFPEAKVMVTGNPELKEKPTTVAIKGLNGRRKVPVNHYSNEFLFNGGGDDVDIFTVLSRRYYGTYSTIVQNTAKRNRSRFNLAFIDRARSRGKMIWSYTYTGVEGTPGFRANEPLSNVRVFFAWNALENIPGTLYGQGITNYTTSNPLSVVQNAGENLLLYPGSDTAGPIASLRLEEVRNGIEEWAIYKQVRDKHGAAKVRTILGTGGAAIFSANASGVQLACTSFCELKGKTLYSWPVWSQDASTAARLEKAKLLALQAASA